MPTTTYGLSTTTSLHLVTGIEVCAYTAGPEGGTKWLEVKCSAAAPLGGFTLSIHAGHSPELWERLLDFERAWQNSALLPQPEAEGLSPADLEAAAEGAFDLGAEPPKGYGTYEEVGQ